MTNNRLDPVALDVSDIQSILGIGKRQAYELANSGQFHIVRVGKRIKISHESFYCWLNGDNPQINSLGKETTE